MASRTDPDDTSPADPRTAALAVANDPERPESAPLTSAVIAGMTPEELANVALDRVGEEVEGEMIWSLAQADLFERLLPWARRLRLRPELARTLHAAARRAAHLELIGVARDLVTLRALAEPCGKVALSLRILAEGYKPGPMLSELEALAEKLLDSKPWEVANELLTLRSTLALGILVVRGLSGIAPLKQFRGLVALSSHARTRLGLPPADPVAAPQLAAALGECQQLVEEVAAAQHANLRLLQESERLRRLLAKRDSQLAAAQRELDECRAMQAAVSREPDPPELPGRSRRLVRLLTEQRERIRELEMRLGGRPARR